MASQTRLTNVIAAVSIGSFRVSAMIAGVTESGELQVLGSANRAARGIKRGYVTDMAGATYAVREVVEAAEKMAGTTVTSVWIGSSGAGLASTITPVEIDIGGRRIEEEDIEHLLVSAQQGIEPDGRTVLHAQPACYFLDGADGVANPKGLHADRLGVDVHVMLADSAPTRNVTEAVQNAHLEVEGIIASPLACGYACLTAEERDLGVAMVEMGGQVTNVAVYAGGMLVGLTTIPRGSSDITDSIASAFGIKRFRAEWLKCVNGSANASPHDHREMVSLAGPDDKASASVARGADDRGHVPRSELISVITAELDVLMRDVGRALENMGFSGSNARARQVVLTGGGAELAGLADYAQSVLGTPVRIGKPKALRGLPEAHRTPGFATLAGLVLYAAEDPVDIRSVGSRFTETTTTSSLSIIRHVWRAMREYF